MRSISHLATGRGRRHVAVAPPPQARRPRCHDKPVATATAEIKGEGITGTATFTEVKHGTRRRCTSS